MIDMEVKAEGVIESLFNQGFKEGFREGRKSILFEFLQHCSKIELAEFLGISLSELNDMIK